MNGHGASRTKKVHLNERLTEEIPGRLFPLFALRDSLFFPIFSLGYLGTPISQDGHREGVACVHGTVCAAWGCLFPFRQVTRGLDFYKVSAATQTEPQDAEDHCSLR